MVNLIVVAIVALIVGLAARYIHKEKKRGVKCVGCPYAGSCSSNCSGSACSCSGHSEAK